MTSGAEPAERALQYAADVTVEDAWDLAEFLLPRLEAAARAHVPGTDEQRAAAALAESVATLVLSLERGITGGIVPESCGCSVRAGDTVTAPQRTAPRIRGPKASDPSCGR